MFLLVLCLRRPVKTLAFNLLWDLPQFWKGTETRRSQKEETTPGREGWEGGGATNLCDITKG